MGSVGKSQRQDRIDRAIRSDPSDKVVVSNDKGSIVCVDDSGRAEQGDLFESSVALLRGALNVSFGSVDSSYCGDTGLRFGDEPVATIAHFDNV